MHIVIHTVIKMKHVTHIVIDIGARIIIYIVILNVKWNAYCNYLFSNLH